MARFFTLILSVILLAYTVSGLSIASEKKAVPVPKPAPVAEVKEIPAVDTKVNGKEEKLEDDALESDADLLDDYDELDNEDEDDDDEEEPEEIKEPAEDVDDEDIDGVDEWNINDDDE